MNDLSNGPGIVVTVSTVVETKSPVGHHSRQTSNLRVLLGNLNRSRASHEVEIQDTTKGVVFQILVMSIGVVDLDIHTVGVEEEDTMRTSVTVIEIDWVVTVQVGTLRNTIGILRPQGTDVVGCVQSHGISVLTKTVKVRVTW